MKEVIYKSNIWDNFKTSNLNNNKQLLLRKRVDIAFKLSLIAALLGGIFTVIELAIGDNINTWISILLVLVTLLNAYLLKKISKVDLTFNNLLIIILFVLGYAFFSGSIDNSGIYWCAIFPVIAFFLKGKSAGLKWVVGYVILLIIGVILSYFKIILLPYSINSVIITLVVYGIITLLIFSYLLISKEYEIIVDDNNQHLLDSIDQLSNEIKQRKATDENLSIVITDTSKKNQQLEDTKKAMLNLLEDLKTAKSNVEQEKAKDEAIISSIGDGLIVTNSEQTIEIINKASEELLGFTNNELLGKKLNDILPMRKENGKTVIATRQPIQMVLTHRIRVTDTTFFLERKDGNLFPIYIVAAPVIINNKVEGAVIVIRDITHEKEIDKTKTEFVSLASHQLRTPLTAINWYVEMLLAGDAGVLSEEQRSFMEEISNGNQRMVALVNALLNVSRIDLGTFAIDPSPTNLVEISDNIIEELSPLINTKKTHIIKKYEKYVPLINADPQLTRIVFQNLLSNAVKYTPNEGTVEIDIAKVESEIHIRVKDTGYGIPKKQQSKIFTKLFRADNVVERETDGTGLGLYIVKSIVEQSGGKIWFESKEDDGTIFYVIFPLKGMKKKEGTKGLT